MLIQPIYHDFSKTVTTMITVNAKLALVIFPVFGSKWQRSWSLKFKIIIRKFCMINEMCMIGTAANRKLICVPIKGDNADE